MSFSHRITPRRDPTPEETAYDTANAAYRALAPQVEVIRRKASNLGEEHLRAVNEGPEARIANTAETYRRAYADVMAIESELSTRLADLNACYKRLVAARGH